MGDGVGHILLLTQLDPRKACKDVRILGSRGEEVGRKKPLLTPLVAAVAAVPGRPHVIWLSSFSYHPQAAAFLPSLPSFPFKSCP